MLAILSPAKTLDYDTPVPLARSTRFRFPDEAGELVKQLQGYTPRRLSNLMNISDNLAQLNAVRYAQWQYPFDESKARQALFAFKGDVYSGMDAYSLNEKELNRAQQNVRILSGLYGLLRPLDLILPYRLEMGTKLKNKGRKDLYAFWGEKITAQLNHDLKNGGHQVLVNLASQEYFKAINPQNIEAEIVVPVFKDYKNGTYKIISFYAKKARGMMVRFMLQNQLANPEELKAFDVDGYHYNNELSNEDEMVFTRH